MPAYSHASYTSTGSGSAIDITVNTAPNCPPVMICTGTGVTYDIEGSHDNSTWASFGTFTAPCAKDLVPGVRFWRTKITVNPGTAFTSSVGLVLGVDGRYSQPGVYAGTGYSAGL